MPKRISSNIVALIFGILLVCFLAAFYISAAWQGPTLTPPDGNVDMPLNVGTSTQTKEGPLALNALGSSPTGLIVNRDAIFLNGDVGIGTTTPSGRLDIVGGPLAVGGNIGAAGQVLRSQGAGNTPQWADPAASGVSKFGGTGADGALSISSGITTLDLGGAAVFTKNYTSISITGTGALAFSNPNANGTIIILKSQGNVTIACASAPCIDASGMGAVAATMAQSLETSSKLGGNGGPIGDFSAPGLGGAGGTIYNGGFDLQMYTNTLNKLEKRFINIFPGSGGVTGGNGYFPACSGTPSSPGTGGRGGGALIIEVAGGWNLTTANGISVAGTNGTNAIPATFTTVNCSASGAGGGSGGAGGSLLVLYNTLVNTGTVNVSSGAGGNGANSVSFGIGSTQWGGGGGAGTSGSINSAGAAGANGGVFSANGQNGSNGSGGGGAGINNATTYSGGIGGAPNLNSGLKIITQNKWF